MMNYPGMYEPKTGSTAVATQSHPAPPSHYFNNLQGIGYGSPSLAHLHQYLVAAHLAQPLRGVPALPVHSSSSNNSGTSAMGGGGANSPLYKDNLDPVAAAVAAELDRKRKRSDSGIEDSLNHKFVSDAKLGRYQQQQQHDQVTVPGHQSPAEMETVKKILETVNANVTRQLLEASVQRVKNAHHVHHLLHRPAITSSPLDSKEFGHELIASKMDEENRRASSISPNVTPGLEDMIEEVPDTSDGDQPTASIPAAASHGHQNGRLDAANDDDMMREDAASETGTDDSGLVMALDQDCGGQRDDSHNSSSNNNQHYSSHSTSAAGGNPSSGAVKTASERTRSTISEDKAAVRIWFFFINYKFHFRRTCYMNLNHMPFFYLISRYWRDIFLFNRDRNAMKLTVWVVSSISRLGSFRSGSRMQGRVTDARRSIK